MKILMKCYNALSDGLQSATAADSAMDEFRKLQTFQISAEYRVQWSLEGLIHSVTRLCYFWKILVTILPAKIAQIFLNFWAIREVATFWATFG